MLDRILPAVVLLAVAAFCGFGFLATYEPPAWPRLRLVYLVVGLVCMVGAGWAAVRKN